MSLLNILKSTFRKEPSHKTILGLEHSLHSYLNLDYLKSISYSPVVECNLINIGLLDGIHFYSIKGNHVVNVTAPTKINNNNYPMYHLEAALQHIEKSEPDTINEIWLKVVPFKKAEDTERCKFIAEHLQPFISKGYKLAFIGKCRTGKTRLLEMLTSQIIDFNAVQENNYQPFLSLYDYFKMLETCIDFSKFFGIENLDTLTIFCKEIQPFFSKVAFITTLISRSYGITFQTIKEFAEYRPVLGHKLLVVYFD